MLEMLEIEVLDESHLISKFKISQPLSRISNLQHSIMTDLNGEPSFLFFFFWGGS
jgi:hypothetical protein